MSKGRTKRVRVIGALTCVVIIIVLTFVVGCRKESLFIDEYFSYSTANHVGREPDIRTGVWYDDPYGMFTDCYVAQEGSLFSYGQIFQNLKTNVHPPLYFLLLHFVCALFPGTFSIWYGMAVNIVFAIISLFCFRRLLRMLIPKEGVVCALSLSYVCSLFLYENTTYLRMYTVAMTFVTALALAVLRYHRGNRSIVQLAAIACFLILGALTHLYFLLYAFFLMVTVCCIRLLHKDLRSVGKLLLTSVVAGGVAIAVFPTMLYQLLGSDRGVEAKQNLLDNDWQHVWEYLSNTSYAIFILGVIGVAILLELFLHERNRRSRGQGQVSWEDVAVLLLPVVLYYLLVGRIAPYIESRYVYPAYPMLLIGTIALLLKVLEKLCRDRTAYRCLAAGFLCLSFLSWIVADIPNIHMWRGSAEEVKQLEAYDQAKAVMIMGPRDLWKIHVTYPYLQYFSQMIRYDADQELFTLPDDEKDIIVVLDRTELQALERLREQYPQYTVTEIPVSTPYFRYYCFSS